MPLNANTELPDRTADRRIESLTPLPRQAFLLTSLEEFSLTDAAAILDVDEDTIRDLIDQAGREISSQIAAKVMIIEDEPMIALDIEQLVTEIGHEVVGIAATRREANALAKSSNPGIILSDIQLADGSSGIDAVNDILKDGPRPVVFITAYPERLLTGERAEPTFLITKPFQPAMVKAVISQALFFDRRASKARNGAR
jgi:CheY-like chemotaxis protein